jgi:hypothetical protein
MMSFSVSIVMSWPDVIAVVNWKDLDCVWLLTVMFAVDVAFAVMDII